MPAIVIGPFAFPASLITLAVALGAGWWCSEWVARRRALPIEPVLALVLATGLLAARLAFVFAYRAAYADAPLAVIDLRDGGWNPWAGFVAAALCIAVVVARRAAYGKPPAAGWGVALCLWLGGGLAASALQEPPAGLPALTLAALDGTPVNIARLQGRPVVLNLWATWCPPCRREMPVLQQGQQRRLDVQFVFVDQGEAASRVQAFLGANRLELRNVLLDPGGQVASQFNARGLPATRFFDARGHLVATRVGALSPATLAERLDALVAPARSSP